MSNFSKKEIIEYQVEKWRQSNTDWKYYLKDTNFYIKRIIENKSNSYPYQNIHWLDELVSCYDLENLKSLN
jgi:hypothetical protein